MKLLSNDSNIYDIHTINKIRQGAAGTELLNVTLSNEDMYVPCEPNGTVTAGALTNASTEITVYEGATNITSRVTITVDKTDNLTGDWDSAQTGKKVYKITAMSAAGADTGRVTFTVTHATKDGQGNDITKTVLKSFYLTKVKRGVDGTSPLIREVLVSALAITKTADNVGNGVYNYSPASFTVSAKEHNGNTTGDYSGRFKITPYVGSVAQDPIMSTTNESSKTHTIGQSTNKYTSFVVELFPKDSDYTDSTKVLDKQTITVVSNGDTGAQGDDAIAFDLGNPSDVIACLYDGAVLSTQVKTIPFAAYKKGQKIACSATIKRGTDANGSTGPVLVSNSSAQQGQSGTITLRFNSGASLNGADSGSVEIELTAQVDNQNSVSVTKIYTWSKGKQGGDAIILRAYAKTGNVINNGDNNVILSGSLTCGPQDIPQADITWQWAKYDFEQQGYLDISSGATQDLTVYPGDVHSYASYRLTAKYNSISYVDYITVQDKNDPLQVEIFSTLGDKITNGVGYGCVYARVFQNGAELDGLQNLIVSIDDPADSAQPNSGDIWVHIDKNGQQIWIKEWQTETSPNKWVNVTTTKEDSFECTYKWKFTDYYGKQTSLGENGPTESSSKFLYVAGNLIDKKMQFNLEVSQK